MDRRLQRMSTARVLVVGDLILDRYWHGATRRISPEAPVPVVLVEDVVERVGGAANVAANAAALGAQVALVGVIGDDAAGDTLERLCAEQGIATDLARAADFATIVKLRVVSQQQQLVRIDFERPAVDSQSAAVLAAVARQLADVDVVVVSDYAKGAAARVGDVIALAARHGTPVVVDPKGSDFARYAGAAVLTPNLHEFEAVAGTCTTLDMLVERGARLLETLDLGALLVTRGEAGMTLIQRDHAPVHVDAQAHDVFDVTGAGDTVCGVLAVALASGCALPAAVALANTAAGLVVGKFGAASVGVDEIDNALTGREGRRRGVLGRDELLVECARARRRGERIVMTNGCFDLLHEGHVRFLAEAKTLGNRLIVAVNDDASVRALKGGERPLNPLASRMHVLAALDVVDWVVPFADATPRALIAEVLPDVLVKGGDYAVADIAGGAEVIAAGGQVMTLGYHDGHSTTRLAARLGEAGRDA
ncbi:MAG: bifunctional D-glycero-beta-D-manno-heptose-7-phosphate kinase/D-glycero-beta-D-manno-heptose 1-phosphate adenylyltransferase HldE [Gammaproteobacteria bacterium]